MARLAELSSDMVFFTQITMEAAEDGLFLDAFRAKEPMADFVATIPVAVILNPESGLLGAAVHAMTQVRAQRLLRSSVQSSLCGARTRSSTLRTARALPC